MGMFDEVKSRHPDVPDHPYQTKGLTNGLDHYTITESGRLILHKAEWDINDKPLFPDKPYIGCMKLVGLDDVDTNHHGNLEIHCWDGEKMISYILTFNHGELIMVTHRE